jgi:glucose/arabinose dehydrogenase
LEHLARFFTVLLTQSIDTYLWDTENGPEFGDEINLVEPGFNSGWEKAQGIWKLDQLREKRI